MKRIHSLQVKRCCNPATQPAQTPPRGEPNPVGLRILFTAVRPQDSARRKEAIREAEDRQKNGRERANLEVCLEWMDD